MLVLLHPINDLPPFSHSAKAGIQFLYSLRLGPSLLEGRGTAQGRRPDFHLPAGRGFGI